MCALGSRERSGPRSCSQQYAFLQQVGVIDQPASTESTDIHTDSPALVLGESVSQRRDHMRIESLSTDTRATHSEPNWDYIEQTMSHVLHSSLALEPKEHRSLFSELNLPNKVYRAKLAELMFEKFETPGLFFVRSAVLASYGFYRRYATGRTNCVVLDSGAGISYAVPICEGLAVGSAIGKRNFGGETITQALLQHITGNRAVTVHPTYMISKRPKPLPEDHPDSPLEFTIEFSDYPLTHPTFHNMSLLSTIRSIKETCFKVSKEVYDDEDYASEPPASYIMPDGSTLDLGNERYVLQERMFTSEGEQGFGQMVSEAVDKCEGSLQKEMLENVVVTGGNTLFPGFTDRMYNELLDIRQKGTKIVMISAPSSLERRFSAWIGGSVIAALQTFQPLWVSRQEYAEHGASIMERECP